MKVKHVGLVTQIEVVNRFMIINTSLYGAIQNMKSQPNTGVKDLVTKSMIISMSKNVLLLQNYLPLCDDIYCKTNDYNESNNS